MLQPERTVVYVAEPSASPEPATEAAQDVKDYPNSTYTIISKIAYLIGVPKKFFEAEYASPKMTVFLELEKDRNARIVRDLCLIRTAIEQNYGKINHAFYYDLKNLHTLPELIPTDSIQRLSQDGIDLIRANSKLNQYLIDINTHIANRINNCKSLLPIWLKWDYIRELFLMPNGTKESGLKRAAEEYYSHKSQYPYQVYINWPVGEQGNILYNDKKFVTLLYEIHEDYFSDMSKVSDAGYLSKEGIYRFLEASRKTAIVVDCENCDPYKLYATLNNLDQNALLGKIAKIILYDDVHTANAWQILDEFTELPVDRVLIQRVKENKSLVDIRLTTGTCREFFQNDIDSFILASSDSDYWGLIPAMPEARFLVLVEAEKCSGAIRKAMEDGGITYCYIDNFCTGNSNQIKETAVLHTVQQFLDEEVNFNINDLLEDAYTLARADMSSAEKRQLYDRYIRKMKVVIDQDGYVRIELGTP